MLLLTLACMHLFESVFLFSSTIYAGLEFLDCMVVLFLFFWGTSILFFIVAAPMYIPNKSAWGFPFLHVLSNICYLQTFWWLSFWQVWGDISLWFWFAFLWWLEMLSIFSCACWLSVCLLWKNVYSGLLLIFKSGCLFVFWYWVVWAVYTFCVLTHYQSYHLQMLSLIQYVVFLFCWEINLRANYKINSKKTLNIVDWIKIWRRRHINFLYMLV